MGIETTQLKLYKANPATDGNDNFNIETMLNANWDKLDAHAKAIILALATHLDSGDHDGRYYTETELGATAGAAKIGAATLSGYTGNTVQALLAAIGAALVNHKASTSTDHDSRYFTETELGATTSGTAGADKIGATAINGYVGATVQALLAAIGTALVQHKNSGDHDGRYYTETELGAITAGTAGADKIGASTIAGLTGNTVQVLLAALKGLIDNANTAITNHTKSGDHDGRYFTEANMAATTDGAAGADKVGATPIAGLTGSTVQVLLEALKTFIDNTNIAVNNHKSSADHDSRYYSKTQMASATGATTVGTTAIAGYTGANVQALLEAIGGALVTHKGSADHDGRYYTEAELGATTSGAAGADKVGATAVSGYTGATVQAILAAIGAALTTHKGSGDHDGRYYTEAELGAAAGAAKIGAAAIAGLTGNNVQALLEALKGYVDAVQQGLDTKESVRVATTANITLSGTQTIDGVAVVAGNRVLVKDQTTQAQNGIYVAAAGAWTRATDADTSIKLSAGTYVFVEEGAVNADSGWVMTQNGTITVGTTAITWSQFSGAGQITASGGLTKSGNTISIAGSGVTDAHIGTRKIDQSIMTASTSEADLTTLLSFIGRQLVKITGKVSWLDTPAATIEALNTKVTDLINTRGFITSLSTNFKGNLVGAINEVYGLATVPLGEIRRFYFGAPSNDWLPCDGSPASSIEYPALYNLLGSPPIGPYLRNTISMVESAWLYKIFKVIHAPDCMYAVRYYNANDVSPIGLYKSTDGITWTMIGDHTGPNSVTHPYKVDLVYSSKMGPCLFAWYNASSNGYIGYVKNGSVVWQKLGISISFSELGVLDDLPVVLCISSKTYYRLNADGSVTTHTNTVAFPGSLDNIRSFGDRVIGRSSSYIWTVLYNGLNSSVSYDGAAAKLYIIDDPKYYNGKYYATMSTAAGSSTTAYLYESTDFINWTKCQPMANTVCYAYGYFPEVKKYYFQPYVNSSNELYISDTPNFVYYDVVNHSINTNFVTDRVGNATYMVMKYKKLFRYSTNERDGKYTYHDAQLLGTYDFENIKLNEDYSYIKGR